MATESSKSRGLGTTTLHGLLVSTASALIVKLSGLLVHLGLGWLLLKQDFALYGMAVSILTFSNALRDGGASRILAQQGRRKPETIRSISVFCLYFNLTAALLTAAAAPIASMYFQEPRVIPLLLVMSLTIAASTPLTIGRARLSAEMKFGPLARFETTAGVGRSVLTLILAASGAGAFSFVVPELIVMVLGGSFIGRLAGPMPAGDRLHLATFWNILGQARWLMLATFASALGATGDYLVLGRFGPDLLSDYFFGFQITVLVSTIFVQLSNQVLMPILAQIQEDRPRIASGFQRISLPLVLIGTTISGGLFLTAPGLIHWIWQGKWDEAIVVVQAMSINLAFRLCTPIYCCLLQATTRWATYAFSFLIEGVIVLATTFATTQFDATLAETAIIIAIARSFTPVIYLLYSGSTIGIRPLDFFGKIAARIALPMLVACAVLGISIGLEWPGQSLLTAVMRGMLFFFAVGFAILLTFRKDVNSVWEISNRRRQTAV